MKCSLPCSISTEFLSDDDYEEEEDEEEEAEDENDHDYVVEEFDTSHVGASGHSKYTKIRDKVTNKIK